MPYRPAFNLTNELSIAVYVRQSMLNNGWILMRNTIDDGHRFYGLFSGDIHKGMAFHYHGEGGEHSVAWPLVTIADSEWHHVALVVEYPVVRLYVDGQPHPERNMAEPIVEWENGDIKFGRRDPGNEYFKGRLDDMRLYDGALTAEEVLGFVGFGEGEGTIDDPYLIYTAAHMQLIGANPQNLDKHFKMMADIDLGGYDGQDGRSRFNIIGSEDAPFTGTFDGGGHRISNFTFINPEYEGVGVFGHVKGEGAVIERVIMVHADVTAGSCLYVGALIGTLDMKGSMSECGSEAGSVSGNKYVGGLVGRARYSFISDCYSRGDVSGISNVGGLIGSIWSVRVVSRSFSEGSVSGEEKVGGLVGYGSGTIRHCYSKASVAGDDYVGGLAGDSYADVYCCYANGEVNGNEHVGGLVGLHHGLNTCCSYWDVEQSGLEYDRYGIGKTTEEMNLEATFEGWGSCGVWRIDEGESPPTLVWEDKPGEIMARPAYGGGSGSEDDPYLIQTDEQLNTIGSCICDWDKHFMLVEDIDLSWYGGENGNPAFTSIGNFVIPFSGVLDGAGHTISNVTLYSSDIWTMGLFTIVAGEDAKIKNVIMEDVELSLADGGGALVGYMAKGSISNCIIEGGTVAGGGGAGGLVGCIWQGEITHSRARCSVPGSVQIGGLVGWSYESDIADCYAEGDVTAVYDMSGGLAGGNEGGIISRCHATSSVVTGRSCAGGLVGVNYYSGYVCYSSAGGDVSGGDEVGGLIGENSCWVSDCYSKARVAGSSYVGGFVGLSLDEYDCAGRVIHCYSTGRVEGEEYVGGLIAANVESQNTGWIEASFWDIEASGQAESGCGTGKTTAEMKQMGTFSSADWDFSTPVWKIAGGMITPWLWWENVYAGGSGTADDPYLIATAEQIQTVGAIPGDWSRHFRLIADIDLAPYTGSSFNVIGTVNDPFTGVFDGGGRTIADFTYASGGEEHVGIFGVVDGDDAEIMNVLLDNPTVAAGAAEAVGALVGYLDGEVVECGVNGGHVTGGDYDGGLVGRSAGEIVRCFAKNDVSGGEGDSYAGGLVGFNRGRVENSYAINEVSGGAAAGGLIGYLSQGRIKNCYAFGIFGGGATIGGVVGRNDRGRITSCYWNIRTSRVRRMCGMDNMGSGCNDNNGLMPGGMIREGTFEDWNFEHVWIIDDDGVSPRLRWEG